MLDLIKHLYTMTGSNVSLSRPEWTAHRHTTPLHLSVTAGGKNKQLFVLKVSKTFFQLSQKTKI